MRAIINTRTHSFSVIHKAHEEASSPSTLPSTATCSLVFPERFHRQYHLRTQLRALKTIEQVHYFTEINTENIRLYGRPMIFEFLNEFQMKHTNFRSMHSQPYQIFKKIQAIQDTSLYEQQLKYSCLMRLQEFARYSQAQLMFEVQKQITRVQMKWKEQPGDYVDAVNWVIMCRHSHSWLAFECMKIVDKDFAVNFKECRMLKSFTMVMKRMIQYPWNKVRQLSNILYSLVHTVEWRDILTSIYFKINDVVNWPETVGFLEVMIDGCRQWLVDLQWICNLQLHTIYYRVPKLIDGTIQIFLTRIDEIDIKDVSRVLGCFAMLPLNYNQAAFQKLYNYILSKSSLKHIHLNNIPFKRLSKDQVNSILRESLSYYGVTAIKQSVYTTSCLARNSIYTQEYCLMLFNLLPDIINKEKPSLLNYQNYIGLFKIIIEKLHSHEKIKEVKELFQVMNRKHMNEFSIDQLIMNFSMPNIFSLLDLSQECSFSFPLAIFSKHLLVTLPKNKLTQAAMFNLQIQETLAIHLESRHPLVRSNLREVIARIIDASDHFAFEWMPLAIFVIEKSSHASEFHKETTRMLDKLSKLQEQAFIEMYMKYQYKNISLTMFILQRLIDRQLEFQLLLKLLSALSPTVLTSMRGSLLHPLKSHINVLNSTLTRGMMENIKFNYLVGGLRFVNQFRDDIPQFAKKYSKLTISCVQMNSELYLKQDIRLITSFLQESYSCIHHYELSQKQIYSSRLLSIITKISNEKKSFYLKVKEFELRCHLKNTHFFSKEKKEVILQMILSTLDKQKYLKSYAQNADAMLVLFKLCALDLIELDRDACKLMEGAICRELANHRFGLTDIMTVLGRQILTKDMYARTNAYDSLMNILECAMQANISKLPFSVSYYYLVLFESLGNKKMIILAAQHTLRRQLQPLLLSKVVSILIKHRGILTVQIADKLLTQLDYSWKYITYEAYQTVYYIYTQCLTVDIDNLTNGDYRKVHSELGRKLEEMHGRCISKLIHQYKRLYIKERGTRAVAELQSGKKAALLNILMNASQMLIIAVVQRSITPGAVLLFRMLMAHLSQLRLEILSRNNALPGYMYSYLCQYALILLHERPEVNLHDWETTELEKAESESDTAFKKSKSFSANRMKEIGKSNALFAKPKQTAHQVIPAFEHFEYGQDEQTKHNIEQMRKGNPQPKQAISSQFAVFLNKRNYTQTFLLSKAKDKAYIHHYQVDGYYFHYYIKAGKNDIGIVLAKSTEIWRAMFEREFAIKITHVSDIRFAILQDKQIKCMLS